MKIPTNIIETYKTFDPEATFFFKYFDEPENSKILEVGSQHAPIASMLAKSGFNVIGVDLRESDQEKTENYQHIKADFCNLPNSFLREHLGTFDSVVTVSAIEHFGLGTYGEKSYKQYYDVIAMKLIYDFLKPNGTCYIVVPFGGKFVEVFPHWRVYDFESLEFRIVQDFYVDYFDLQVSEKIRMFGKILYPNESISTALALHNMIGHPSISIILKMIKTNK